MHQVKRLDAFTFVINGLAIAARAYRFWLWSSLRIVGVEIGFIRVALIVAVTFTAFTLLSPVTVRFRYLRSLLLSFFFRPQALLSAAVLPSYKYFTIMRQTVEFETPTSLAVSEIEAPAWRAPSICPRWNSERIGAIFTQSNSNLLWSRVIWRFACQKITWRHFCTEQNYIWRFIWKFYKLLLHVILVISIRWSYKQ